MRHLFFAFFILALCLVMGSNSLAGAKTILLLEHEQPSAWTELLQAGLQKGAKDFHMDAEVRFALPESNQTEIFRKAAEDADLVIVASDNLHEILRDNAGNFRRTHFGSIDAGIRASNIMSITFEDEQAAFLAGAAAAMLTAKSGIPGINSEKTIGWLSGKDTPSMRTMFNGFVEGAKLADPQVRVIQALCDTFTDASIATSKAKWLANAGADVIVAACGAVGLDLEKHNNGPQLIHMDKIRDSGIGAITKAADKAVYEIMASEAGGNFKGKEIIAYNLANGGADFAGYDNFVSGFINLGDVKRRVKELRHELINKSIRLPSFRARTLCDCLD